MPFPFPRGGDLAHAGGSSAGTMDDSLFSGILALLVAKLIANAFATRLVSRMYRIPRTNELGIGALRTAVGFVAGLVYAPVMARYGWAPWSASPQPWLFLLGLIPFSAAIWWWFVMWFFHRKSAHAKPLIKAVAVAVAIPGVFDVLGVLRVIPIQLIWIV